MRTITKMFILFIMLSLVISCCATKPKYYSTLAEVKQIPEFKYEKGGDLYGGYYVDNLQHYYGSPDKELERAFEQINRMMTGERGIYSQLFCVKEECANKKNSNVPIEKTSEVHAYVSVLSQPVSPKSTQNNEATTDKPSADANDDSQSKSTPKKSPTNTCNACKNKKTTDKPSTDKTVDDPLKKDIQIIVSSYLYSINTADRLEKVYTLIVPLQGGVEFVKIESPHEKSLVNLGEKTTDVKLGATAGLPPIMSTTLSLSPSLENSLKQTIQKQYIIRDAEIFPLKNVLMISQDGGPANSGIGGSVEINTTVRFPPNLCKYLTVFEIEKSTPSELNLKSTPVCYIDKVPALAASVGLARTVKGGKETVQEDDDEVIPIAFKNICVIDLWSNIDSLYGVKFVGSNEEYPITFGDKSIGNVISFKKFEDALIFKDWISKIRTDTSTKMTLKIDGDNKIDSLKNVPASSIKAEPQICIAGTSASDLSKHHIAKRFDLCDGTGK
jgi:hypothetical protein